MMKDLGIIKDLAIALGVEVKAYTGNELTLSLPIASTPETKDDVAEVITYLNKVANKNYKPNSKANQKFTRSILKEYSVADAKKVIDVKANEWLGTKQELYLRPETLFNRTKFEAYINQANINKTPLRDLLAAPWK